MKGHFEAKKHAIRQTQDGWVVSFVVHPNDMTPEFAAAPLGTRLMVGYAEIGDDEQPTPEPPKAPDNAASERGKEAYRAQDAMEQARTRAVMLCKDVKFQHWMAERHNGFWLPSEAENHAATRLCDELEIDSRSEIASDEHVYRAFLAIEQTFREWIGLAAEQRS